MAGGGCWHREGAHITSRAFRAPMASGPSSAIHFLEPSARCSAGFPRLARMNFRGLKPLRKGLAAAPALASTAGARADEGEATGLAMKFTKKAAAANTRD